MVSELDCVDCAEILKERSEQIVKLREFLRLVKETPENELHLLPLAADALLSELGE